MTAAGALLAGCLDERARPSPPLLRVTLEATQVTSPDTLRGSVRAEDGDGIDSVWVTLDTVRAGTDGFFDRVVTSDFRFMVPSGLAPGTLLVMRFEARDIVGFVGQIDTSVTVVP